MPFDRTTGPPSKWAHERQQARFARTSANHQINLTHEKRARHVLGTPLPPEFDWLSTHVAILYALGRMHANPQALRDAALFICQKELTTRAACREISRRRGIRQRDPVRQLTRLITRRARDWHLTPEQVERASAMAVADFTRGLNSASVAAGLHLRV